MINRDEYDQLVKLNMDRYNGDRDRAIRSANIAGGFGNSTAQRFMHSGILSQDNVPTPAARPSGGGGGGGDIIPRPQLRPDAQSPARPPDQMWQNPPSPPSPMRDPSLMWPGATAGPPTSFSPDLAVSPQHERWPGATQGLSLPSVPANPAMSMASILRTLPPELVRRLFEPGGTYK
jgi:hypothetical protein